MRLRVFAGRWRCTISVRPTHPGHPSPPPHTGNVAYGAKVGSNHTGRAADQEAVLGEGVFFGLGVGEVGGGDEGCNVTSRHDTTRSGPP